MKKNSIFVFLEIARISKRQIIIESYDADKVLAQKMLLITRY